VRAGEVAEWGAALLVGPGRVALVGFGEMIAGERCECFVGAPVASEPVRVGDGAVAPDAGLSGLGREPGATDPGPEGCGPRCGWVEEAAAPSRAAVDGTPPAVGAGARPGDSGARGLVRSPGLLVVAVVCG
jgi:hypothetical protein